MQPLEEVPHAYQSPLRLFLITIAGIFLAEVVAMIVVYLLAPRSYLTTVLIDATIMTVLIFPVVYFLSTRPLLLHLQQRTQAERLIRERIQKERLLLETIHTMQLEIARDLHDTLGQNISFLRMKLDHLAGQTTLRRAEMLSEIQHMVGVADESYDLLRGTLAVLESESSTDLFRLFTRYAEQIGERSPFTIHFSSQGEPGSMSAKRMRQLFYIFREMLNNVEKHAQATEVVIHLSSTPEHLQLEVSDNGVGFHPQEMRPGGHYGLRFMRERAELLNGNLLIHSTEGAGTKVSLRVPCE